MADRPIKYRQAIYYNGKFNHWHYWGFINTEFIGPVIGICSMEEVIKNSYQYTCFDDKHGVEIYEGDRWRRDDYDGYIGIVVWENPGWDFSAAEDSKCYSYPPFHTKAADGEVIGNKVEHPKLMKNEI